VWGLSCRSVPQEPTKKRGREGVDLSLFSGCSCAASSSLWVCLTLSLSVAVLGFDCLTLKWSGAGGGARRPPVLSFQPAVTGSHLSEGSMKTSVPSAPHSCFVLQLAFSKPTE
jgi:hypothetical protein